MRAKSFTMISAIVCMMLFGAAACTTNGPSLDPSATKAAFREAHLTQGIELGYNNRLYRLIEVAAPATIGTKIGVAVYHGTLGQGFTLYHEKNTTIAQSIVFQAETGQYFKAVAVKDQP